jgi:P2-related tail formation protein
VGRGDELTDTFTSTLLDDLAVWVTPAQDPTGDHAKYLSALGSMAEQCWSLVMDQGFPDDSTWVPGYSTLLNPTTCPTAFLPYLAQFVGAQIPSGSTDAVARQIIRAEAGMQRGTGFGGSYTSSTIPAGGAIVSAAQRNLSGGQHVTLFERTAADGSTRDPYHFVLVVLTSEVVSATKLTTDVNNVKPAGIQWTLTQTSTWTIAQLEAAYATVTLAEAAFSTVTHLETDVLG